MEKKKYQLRPSSSFIKDFKKLPYPIQKRVFEALKEIEKDPYSTRNISKLSNMKIGIWRKRVGDYRIRYDIKRELIILYSVEHRRKVYER